MKITFLQQGATFTIGDYNVTPTFITPIGPNIKQLVRFTEVGSDTSLSVYVVTDVNGTTESGHTVSLKNVYDGMIFDLSSLAPLTGKDVVSRTNCSLLRDGVRVSVTVRFTTPKGKAFSVYAYPCGSLRLGNTGAVNTFSEYNYARRGLYPKFGEDSPLKKVDGYGAVAGFFDGMKYSGGSLTEGQNLGVLTTESANGVSITKSERATLSVYIRNASPRGFIDVKAYNGTTLIKIQAGETKRVELPLLDLGAQPVPAFILYNHGSTSVTLIVSRMCLNVGGCAAPYVLGGTDKTDRGELAYVGYLTDYRDGYFNLLGREEIGQRSGGEFSGALQVNDTGLVFVNSVYYPLPYGTNMEMHLIDGNGEVTSTVSQNVGSGARIGPEAGYAFSDKVYSFLNWKLYGVERYKKKLYYDEPLEKKIILRWLNSRGAWDSMYFVNFKMTPQINSMGTVDSFDFNVSVVIDWDNEEALYYLTRSPYIMALTPADVGQWGWASSESNGVFALQGGNIGKTLNLKFNYKINQA